MKTSLFAQLGGSEAVNKAVDLFYDKVLAGYPLKAGHPINSMT
jgi:truncated hemoglobin YjbI